MSEKRQEEAFGKVQNGRESWVLLSPMILTARDHVT